MFGLFSRKQPEAPAIDASTAARVLSRHRSDGHRALVRSTVDQMRDRMGLPALEWPPL